MKERLIERDACLPFSSSVDEENDESDDDEEENDAEDDQNYQQYSTLQNKQ